MIFLTAAISLAAPLTICPERGYRTSCVVDGDTWWEGREKIRIRDIDTAEMKWRCPYERGMALRAQARLLTLLNAGPRQIERHGYDRSGRTLATVRVNGRDVGRQLVREGLARKWDGRRRSWC